MQFQSYDPSFVSAVRAGGPDANGQPPERGVSDGSGNPCRACLQNIEAGTPMLILAARPFPTLQPYAETGPIFLHADDCAPWHGPGIPPILTGSPDYLIKAYTDDYRILYGTGAIVASDDLAAAVEDRLADPDVAFVDVRSARNNCFQARARRAADM
ncbi:MAG: DUF1203 domain-containing protein [Pseudomonadota bacterium]